MPQGLAFLQPESVEQATRLLAEYGDEAKVVAGGTALTIMLRQRLIAPRALVSLARLAELRAIQERDGEIVLGALATHREVEKSALVRERIPVLASAFGMVANVRVRNVATVGGVVAEADYASDPPAVFVGLDAVVEARGPGGARAIPARDFFRGFYETALAPGELVTAVRVPVPPAGTGATYVKYVTRSSEDRPCVGVFAAVRLGPDGATCEEARIVVGAAAETPRRFASIERLAQGRALTPQLAREIADGYADATDALSDMRGSAWYRKEMIRVWVARALEHAHADARRRAAYRPRAASRPNSAGDSAARSES